MTYSIQIQMDGYVPVKVQNQVRKIVEELKKTYDYISDSRGIAVYSVLDSDMYVIVSNRAFIRFVANRFSPEAVKIISKIKGYNISHIEVSEFPTHGGVQIELYDGTAALPEYKKWCMAGGTKSGVPAPRAQKDQVENE